MLYFGAFGFDVGTGRLTRDGADVALGRTAARVLTVLLEHRPRTVTQEEILRTVWPSHVVDRGRAVWPGGFLSAHTASDPRGDTDSVLRSIGFQAAAIVRLRADGVV